MAAAGKFLWAELVARFGFETLIVNRLRRRIRGADLARDLFARAACRSRSAVRFVGAGLAPPWRRATEPARIVAANEFAA